MSHRAPRALLLASFALAPQACRGRGATTPAPALRVAAAADLSDAFTALAARFEALTGTPVALTFGSSGMLARQIAEGAPYDLFASADASFADRALASGRCDATSRAHYARGRLAVVTRPGLAPVTSLDDLAAAAFARVAVANPEHAPYGRAAMEALTRAGLAEQLRPRLVFAENVRQTLQLATTGNADAAIVARALAPPEALALPPSLHAPLEQALVACGPSPARRALARRFADLVLGPEGRAELARRGFDPPAR